MTVDHIQGLPIVMHEYSTEEHNIKIVITYLMIRKQIKDKYMDSYQIEISIRGSLLWLIFKTSKRILIILTLN